MNPKTRVAVVGLWHLGSTIAACLAKHVQVVGLDENDERIVNLRDGRAPVFEPGLDDALREAVGRGRLTFTSDVARALEGASIVWIAYDTPVDDADEPDAAYVRRRIELLFPYLADGSALIVSSQVPVGFTRSLRRSLATHALGKNIGLVYTPENLRLGSALASFEHPGRIVAGFDGDERIRIVVEQVFAAICERVEWMRLESAEMTKHALNAFLGVSIAFANEIARACERTGGDYAEVEGGLRSDPRIGQNAYLASGLGFSGGTLARDLRVLTRIGSEYALENHVIAGALSSNRVQQGWLHGKMREVLGSLSGKRITVLGLTYKPGTNTLRRSAAVEFCREIAREGAEVVAYDPVVVDGVNDLAGIAVGSDLEESVAGADALAVMTDWPVFREITAETLRAQMRGRIVFDPKRVLCDVASERDFAYYTVGLDKA